MGSVNPALQLSADSVFATSLDLPVKSGEVVSVDAALTGSEGSIFS